MSEHTPTTDEVRRGFAEYRVPFHKGWFESRAAELEVGEAEFDRWLAGVKAEAWDEGEQAGLRRADFEYGHAPIQAVKRNPYRGAPEQEGKGDEHQDAT